MPRTFTYTFANGLGNLSIVTPDGVQAVTTSNGTYTGFAISSIGGTFNGQQVTGLFGNSGAYQDTSNPNASRGDTHDNAIFVNSSQGSGGRSFNGIDVDGIDFVLLNGNHVNFYSQRNNNTSYIYTTFDNNSTPVGSTAQTATLTQTNYDTAVCFATGTLIRTARGEVTVEDLVTGDLAVTVSGALRPVTWIGHRERDGGGRALPHDQQPIRVRAGAFGPGLPARTLRLSPGHPVLVGADADGAGGHLVPVMCLINGTSIAREAAGSVTYWHVELDAHDILLAEGLPAESYHDMGSRAWFAGEDGALVDPDFVPAGEHGRCRPVAVDGLVVEAERRRIDAVFVAELAGHSAWGEADAVWLAA